MSLPALVSHEILYASIESVHFTITNVARNAQGYSVFYQICSLYKYIVAQNVQRVTEPLPAKTVSFLSRRTCFVWPANLCYLAGYNSLLVGKPCRPEYLPTSAQTLVFVGQIDIPATGRWDSRIPGVPGIRTARHIVPVPGMEAVSTV